MAQKRDKAQLHAETSVYIDNFPFSPQVWGSLRSPHKNQKSHNCRILAHNPLFASHRNYRNCSLKTKSIGSWISAYLGQACSFLDFSLGPLITVLFVYVVCESHFHADNSNRRQ